MAYTMIEKILLVHSDQKQIRPGDIVDVTIDARVARDFGGANVVNNIERAGLGIENPQKTYFTFDCNPGGSDQKYAANQQRCRIYAREHNIKIYDISCGIGTHIAIDEALVLPGGTFVSTDSHANIMGAIGTFGQGMGDQDIAAAWAKGKVWFKAPPTVKITLQGEADARVTAKDVILGMLKKFGANTLLGYAVEMYGDYVNQLTLAERVTIASMGTEMGAIIILFPPNEEVLSRFPSDVAAIYADADAIYAREYQINLAEFEPYIARPGHPEDVIPVTEVAGTKIDSVFIGSCTNGRYRDMKMAAEILQNRKVAPGLVLKIVPSTNAIWNRCLQDGIIETFKKAGALVGNPGCAGCAAGQIGQNGPGEITVSTGNRNFPGKQGGGQVYLASPATAAASAIAGFITSAENIPEQPAVFVSSGQTKADVAIQASPQDASLKAKGRVWIIDCDNIDTDMIFHNRHLTVIDIEEMGQYAFGNLSGWEDFSSKAQPGDIIFTGKNFGCGSSRQQAVDCFASLGISALVAESFGAIYERNAINAAFPILTSPKPPTEIGIKTGEQVEIDFVTGELVRESGEKLQLNPFFAAQLEIYQRGGLLK